MRRSGGLERHRRGGSRSETAVAAPEVSTEKTACPDNFRSGEIRGNAVKCSAFSANSMPGRVVVRRCWKPSAAGKAELTRRGRDLVAIGIGEVKHRALQHVFDAGTALAHFAGRFGLAGLGQIAVKSEWAPMVTSGSSANARISSHDRHRSRPCAEPCTLFLMQSSVGIAHAHRRAQAAEPAVQPVERAACLASTVPAIDA